MKTLRDRIRHVLIERGPLTSKEIADELGLKYDSVRRAISEGHLAKPKAFYVAGFTDKLGAGWRPQQGYILPSLWAVGNRRDEPYPKVDPREKNKRRWERTKLKREIKKAEGNHFACLIAQVTQ